MIKKQIKIDDDILWVYLVGGSENAIVILPGGPGLGIRYLYDDLKGQFPEKNSLFFIDPRGSGHSTCCDDDNINMTSYVADLEHIRRSLGIRSFHLAGHSFGGLQALYYAHVFPEYLKSLILIDPDPPRYKDWIEFRSIVEYRRPSEDRKIIGNLTSQEDIARNPSMYEQLMKILLKPYFHDQANTALLRFDFDEELILKYQKTSNLMRKSLGQWDISGKLREIECPVLLITGESSIFPEESFVRLAASLKYSVRKKIAGAGHFPFLENPAEMKIVFHEFLDKVQ